MEAPKWTFLVGKMPKNAVFSYFLELKEAAHFICFFRLIA